MKLSLRGEYALRALIILAQRGTEAPTSIQYIARQQNIPKRYLEQILNDLRSAGFVQSKRGVAGGYRLARPADSISLAQIIRHLEGALAPVSCVSEQFYKKCTCPDELRCPIRSVMREIRQAIVGIAEKVTLEELVRRSKELQSQPMTALDFSI